jgi:putative transposase
MAAREISWPHAPEHRITETGTYFITASTYTRQNYFRGPERLGVLYRGLLGLAAEYGWRLEAWAVFSNHYHFVGHSPAAECTAENLRAMLGELHQRTAKWINRVEKIPGRKVWHNFRDSKLTFERSYLARLAYTHQDAVRHGLVRIANQYPWCSASWFERVVTPAMVKTIYRFDTQSVRVPDEFVVSPDW